MTNSKNSFLSRIQVILLPVDGSENSDRAAQVAIDFAKMTSARLVIMHVVNIGIIEQVSRNLGKTTDEVKQKYRKEAQSLLEKHSLMSKNAGVNASTSLEFGLPSEKILQLASTSKADIIVMGAIGASQQTRIEVNIGSSTERVIRRAPCSVFVVR
ncbi:MAG: universal stress protein [Candidatus Thorarchaeota archaeon]